MIIQRFLPFRAYHIKKARRKGEPSEVFGSDFLRQTREQSLEFDVVAVSVLEVVLQHVEFGH